MRLINTSTLGFGEFYDSSVPRYAILSHRWSSVSEDEVTFKEHRKGIDKAVGKPGWEKITQLCNLAKADGLAWAWIDTCCIDKRSSAELTEAINSMFNWYRGSTVCYAYLNDCTGPLDWQRSLWWTRGWTLQELIAPRKVIFYDRTWNKIGTKWNLGPAIEAVTGIPNVVLAGSEHQMYMHWSVAQKLSWAAGRETSRIEDRAYSLLGLFHVNMPLLYGEGAKAFERLQLEILQKYADESIFAWRPDPDPAHKAQLLLASDPDSFLDCADMQPSGTYASASRESAETTLRLLHPPRKTSWGIEIVANAHKLYPLQELVDAHGTVHPFLWAVTLTSAWNDRIRQLPCTIILIQHGPITFSYKRLECYQMSQARCFSLLQCRYNIGVEEKDRTFFLQYDADFGCEC